MSELRLWPAIDLRAGRVVRLLFGALSAETVYETRPDEVARRFEGEGADGIHVVDLDAAFRLGENRAVIERILATVTIPVQVGGGLRSRADIERYVGRARVVLGSLPFQDADLFGAILRDHGVHVVVALDCKDGRPTVEGWTVDAGAGGAVEAAACLEAQNVATLLVTDVARDGAMTGPNLDLLRSVRHVFTGEILASGGVRGEEDLAPIDVALAGGPRGVILGRALHSGATSVARLRSWGSPRPRRGPDAGLPRTPTPAGARAPATTARKGLVR